MKTCTGCGQTKSLTDFHRSKRGRGGISARCKQCARQQTYVEWIARDPEGRRASRTENTRKYRARLLSDPQSAAAYRRRKSEYMIQWQKRKKNDVAWRLKMTIRSRLACAIKGKSSRNGAVRHLGCSVPDLMAHLECQFDDGMTWENYGIGGWEVDHIKPLAAFDLTDVEQFRAASHYTNLQPLWGASNRAKAATYIPR